MDKSLKRVRKGLGTRLDGYPVKWKRDHDAYSEEQRAKITFDKNRYICFIFRYDRESHNLAGFMDIVTKDGRKDSYRRSYSFSDTIRKVGIPGFSDKDISLLKTAFLYERKDGLILSAIDPEIQAEIFLEAIKSALPGIIKQIEEEKEKGI